MSALQVQSKKETWKQKKETDFLVTGLPGLSSRDQVGLEVRSRFWKWISTKLNEDLSDACVARCHDLFGILDGGDKRRHKGTTGPKATIHHASLMKCIGVCCAITPGKIMQTTPHPQHLPSQELDKAVDRGTLGRLASGVSRGLKVCRNMALPRPENVTQGCWLSQVQPANLRWCLLVRGAGCVVTPKHEHSDLWRPLFRWRSNDCKFCHLQFPDVVNYPKHEFLYWN